MAGEVLKLRFAAMVPAIVCLGAAVLGGTRVSTADARDARSTLAGLVELLGRDGKRSPAANTVVWIPGIAPEDAGGAPVMASKDKRFAPHVLAVAAGTEVSFPNVDPIFHNVFSLSPENRFDLGLYRKGAAKSVHMVSPGLVRVFCNIHADMAAFVMVLDHAAFTVTGPDGRYRFASVPAGAHVVHVWNERAANQERAITIEADAASPHADFVLDVSTFKAQSHKNKFGREYPPVNKDVDRY